MSRKGLRKQVTTEINDCELPKIPGPVRLPSYPRHGAQLLKPTATGLKNLKKTTMENGGSQSVRNSTFRTEENNENHQKEVHPKEMKHEEKRLITERALLADEIKELTQYYHVKMSKDDTDIALLQAGLEFLANHLEKLSKTNEMIWNEVFDVNTLRKDRQQQNTLCLDTRFMICRLREEIENRRRVEKSSNSNNQDNPINADQKCCGSSKNARKLEHLDEINIHRCFSCSIPSSEKCPTECGFY